MKTANGENHEIPVRAVLEAYKPNKMNTREKIRNYLASIRTALSGGRNGVDTGTGIQPTAEPD